MSATFLPTRRSVLANSAALGVIGVLHGAPVGASPGNAIRSFSTNVPEEALLGLLRRTAATRWPDRETAAALDNPDHVSIVLHNYRWRLGLAEGEPKYDHLEKRLAVFPIIAVPTITLEGDASGAPHPDPSAYAKKLSNKYEHRLITGGVRHNLPQEAPRAFAQAVIDVASES